MKVVVGKGMESVKVKDKRKLNGRSRTKKNADIVPRKELMNRIDMFDENGARRREEYEFIDKL